MSLLKIFSLEQMQHDDEDDNNDYGDDGDALLCLLKSHFALHTQRIICVQLAEIPDKIECYEQEVGQKVRVKGRESGTRAENQAKGRKNRQEGANNQAKGQKIRHDGVREERSLQVLEEVF